MQEESRGEDLVNDGGVRRILSEPRRPLFEARVRATGGCEEKRETIAAAAAPEAPNRRERSRQPVAVVAARNAPGTKEVRPSRLDKVVRVERVGSRGRLRIGGERNGDEQGQGRRLADWQRAVGRGDLWRSFAGRLRYESAVLDCP